MMQAALNVRITTIGAMIEFEVSRNNELCPPVNGVQYLLTSGDFWDHTVYNYHGAWKV